MAIKNYKEKQMEWIENLQNELRDRKNDFENIFVTYAKELMNSYQIVIADKKIEITEVEFYYFCCDNHPDTFVHLDPLQRKAGQFYVHKKSSNRGGIDITFGDGNYFGGILIRGIKVDGKYIAGPSKVRGEIASLMGLVEKIAHKDLQDGLQDLKIEEKKDKTTYEIASSTRVGLSEDKDKNFAYRKYRFVREDYLEALPEDFEGTRGNLHAIEELKKSL